MMNWCHRRHPSVSVHPTSRLSDILTHMQTRGRLGALWKLLVLSYNGRLGARSCSGPRSSRRTVMWLVRGCKSRTANTAEGTISVDTARIDAEWGGCLSLVTLVDVDAGHAGDVQAVAVETITGEAFWNTYTAAVGAAIQDTTLLGL